MSPSPVFQALRDRHRLRPSIKIPALPPKLPPRLSPALDGLAPGSKALPLAVAASSPTTSTTTMQSLFSRPCRSHKCPLAQSTSPKASNISSPSNKPSRRMRPQ
ncbi:hypothetical protein CCHR01_20025 [Colletotrichum chrysophilum]|uniref:Uncharacterized protein n=1 Tax=Colletotrichum chrysophilum TaxID=1836956 RepID=A0AAD8ZXZ4_9PEZI|nr:hypothetical protein CCHR01_20025 [Colletotrichum chrysophilum]